MKKFIIITISAIVVIAGLFSCGGSSTNSTETAKVAREQFIRDSIAHAEFVRDSIAKAERNAKIIEANKPLFKTASDEFSNCAWVEPKSAPKYRNQNGVYCYFQLENNEASNLRFVFQYYADEWLFIRNMIFNIDGENITIAPDMDTDCGNGGMIWEWCDEKVGYGVSEDFIKKLAYATSVKVKLNGSQYYDTKTLTSAQIKSIKDTYEYYTALGGRI